MAHVSLGWDTVQLGDAGLNSVQHPALCAGQVAHPSDSQHPHLKHGVFPQTTSNRRYEGWKIH